MKRQSAKKCASAYKIKVLKISAVCALLVMLAVFITTPPDALARSIWRQTHIAPLATLLVPNDASLRFEIGNYYFGGGAYDVDRAQGYFEKALAIDPQTAGAHYQLARVYFIRGDFSTALDEINKELELHPDFKRSYYVRGLIYGYSKRYKEAEADFKEFLKWKPESWAGHNDLAWVYFMEGDYKNSAETAREGLKYVPNNVWLLNSLGVALLNDGKLAEAKKALTEALASADAMTPADWGRSYPGNNPSVYGDGLDAMRASIKRNLALITTKSAGVK